MTKDFHSLLLLFLFILYPISNNSFPILSTYIFLLFYQAMLALARTRFFLYYKYPCWLFIFPMPKIKENEFTLFLSHFTSSNVAPLSFFLFFFLLLLVSKLHKKNYPQTIMLKVLLPLALTRFNFQVSMQTLFFYQLIQQVFSVSFEMQQSNQI